ncbi:MAG TPA: CHAD domain-containing protein [Candidatus Angelobacter sp.]
MSLLDKRVTKLLEGLSSAVARLADEASPKSVHRLRTTIRRIESLVAFAGPNLGRKQQRALESLAALRKRAGKIRDLDVQMGLLGAIANGSTAGDRRVLAEMLKRKRTKQAERVKSAIGKLQDSKVLAHIERIGEKAAVAAPETASLPAEEARQQLSHLAAEFTSHDPIKARFLHEVRIRMKMIRYLAELGDESADQRRFLQALKSAQDALGAWHDWEELAKTAEKQFDGRMNCPLLMEVRALFAAKYSAATAAVAQLFSLDSPAPARKQPGSAEAPAALARPA